MGNKELVQYEKYLLVSVVSNIMLFWHHYFHMETMK